MLTISSSGHNRRRRGFSLTELVIVLGIISLVTGAIWAAAGSVLRNRRVASETRQVAIILQNMRTLYQKHSRFTTGGNITTAMVRSEVFPQDMLANSADVTPSSIWNTDVSITSVAGGNTFDLVYASTIPTEDCIYFVARMVGPGRDAGLLRVLTDNIDLDTPDLMDQASATAIGTCKQVSFTYNIKG